MLWHWRDVVLRTTFSSARMGLGLKSRYVRVDDVTWHVCESRRWIAARPTLILIHGFSANMEMWLDFLFRMSGQCNVVLVDMPGHGRTEHHDERLNFSLREQAARLEQLFDTCGYDRFILGGSSMGGGIAALYANAYPARLQKLILFNAAGFRKHRVDLDAGLENGKNPLIARSREEFYQVLDFITEKPMMIPWPLKPAWADEAVERQVINETIFSHIFEDVQYFSDNAETILSDIHVPTLIVWGHKDRVLSHRDAHEFDRYIPDSTLLIYDDLGHVPMMEAPGRVARDVKAFMQESEA